MKPVKERHKPQIVTKNRIKFCKWMIGSVLQPLGKGNEHPAIHCRVDALFVIEFLEQTTKKVFSHENQTCCSL